MPEEEIVPEKYGIDESRFEGEFLKLEPNKPVDLEFTPGSIRQIKKEVRDDKTGETLMKWFVEIGIDAINGKPIPDDEPKTLSFTSKRLYNALKPFMDKDETIYKKTIRITKTGEKFQTQYSAMVKGDRKFASEGNIEPEKEKIE